MPKLNQTVEFEFMQRVRNKITGVEGLVTAYALYATGCTHYSVTQEGLDKDGKPYEAAWNDALYLKAVKPPPETSGLEARGGPSDDPPTGM